MVQSPSWEANRFAASQEIPRISRNPKVHFHTHRHPPPVSVLGQPNPVHIPTSHLLEIHPNIIHPSMPRSPQWSPSLRFPHQDPIQPLPLLTHTSWTQLRLKHLHKRRQWKRSACFSRQNEFFYMKTGAYLMFVPPLFSAYKEYCRVSIFQPSFTSKNKNCLCCLLKLFCLTESHMLHWIGTPI